MKKIAFVLGTRPEIIKMYSCIKYCVENNIEHIVINTDQHYDKDMRDVFFDELGLAQPDYQLGVGSGSHVSMLASILLALEEVLHKEKPGVVVVQGDTNTVLAGALAANKMGIKLAHVEAGLRSYDKTMPEEYNRIVTDHCSDYLFAPTEKQAEILKSEAIDPSTVYVTGNTIVDSVIEISRKAPASSSDKPYLLLTCHRPSNTDDKANMTAILSAVQAICEQEDLRCKFPVHPRLGSQLSYIKSFDRIDVVKPLAYSELLADIKQAAMVLTDSGGIQEEACILQKKCIILRTNTERPETVEVGGAALLGEISQAEITSKYQEMKSKQVKWYNPFGDGKSGERIIGLLQGK
jgi:UDP-N-acetylglucosamine 2-epimerase (non-hydrolysing)